MPENFGILSFISGAPGAGELLVLFLVVLVLFGPRRLPEMARSIGRVLNELRRASDDFKQQIMSIDEAVDVDTPDEDHWVSQPPPQATQAREDLNLRAEDAVQDCPEDAARLKAEADIVAIQDKLEIDPGTLEDGRSEN